MNGRIYDPAIARFLTPDPLVSMRSPSQSWNRYSYAENSPLRFVDPSGFIGEDGPTSYPLTPQNWIPGTPDPTWSYSAAWQPAWGMSGSYVTSPVPVTVGSFDEAGAGASSNAGAPNTPQQGGDSPASGARCGAMCQSEVRKAFGDVSLSGDSKTGWNLIRLTGGQTWFQEDTNIGDGVVRSRSEAVLKQWVVDRLQPILDRYKLGISLACVQAYIGTNDDSGRSPSLGVIRLPTPGSIVGISFWNSADTLLHELGHQVQMATMGEAGMLLRWEGEKGPNGSSDAHYNPNTLEARADQFARFLLPVLVQ